MIDPDRVFCRLDFGTIENATAALQHLKENGELDPVTKIMYDGSYENQQNRARNDGDDDYPRRNPTSYKERSRVESSDSNRYDEF